MEQVIAPHWSPVKKTLTFFASVYFLLYMFPRPFNEISGLESIISIVAKPFDFLHLWLGSYVLHIPNFAKPESNGSGDTTFEYVKVLSYLIWAIILTLFATIAFRRRPHFTQFHDWTVVYARYYVGLFMIIYGLAKLNNGQFAFPNLYSLDETYGDSPPMALLWRFMGYSKGYIIFSGIGEITGGLLLIFRRTTILGGLITLGVMLNVAMLNFCYDVPVKLFSGHLVLITLFIIAPWLKSVWRFFVTQKVTTIHYPPMRLPKKWMRVSRMVTKILLLISLPVVLLTAMDADKGGADKSQPLHGVYQVETFQRTNVPHSGGEDTLRWKKLVIDQGYVRLTMATDSERYYRILTDTGRKMFTLQSFRDTSLSYPFYYQQLDTAHLRICGVFKGDSVSINMKQKRPQDFQLVKRGFHWINEYPYNW